MTEDNREERGERVVACPVEGCDATPLARGVNLHILRSSGGGHGEQGDFPDDVSLDDLEEIGRKEVSVNYPDDRESESRARLCPYCRQHFSGKSGVQIHLGQMSGRKNHPPEASALHDPEDFPVVELDEDENITSVVSNPRDVDRENTGDEADGEEAFTTFSRTQMDYLYQTLSAAGVKDERVKMMLQRPYIDPLNHDR
jgi:hypothetical protein